MKRTLLALAAILLLASSAFASGVDLSVHACPGNAGVSSDAGTLDCASGQVLTLYAVFQPVAAIPDLVEVDMRFDLVVDGDLTSDATFWNFEHNDGAPNNEAGLTANRQRPATGCSGYTNTWSAPGAGDAVAA